MGVVRNRTESGRKAAATNQSKDANYYDRLTSQGGKAVAAGKRAFSTVVGLASQAARKRHGIKNEHTIEYIVSVAGLPAYTAHTRESARFYKRLIAKDKGLKARIDRVEYSGVSHDGAFILVERNKLEEHERIDSVISKLGAIKIEQVW